MKISTLHQNLYLSADFHFGHRNIIEYQNRPFDNVAHMDATLIKNWNSQVTKNDVGIILGDITMEDTQQFWSYVNKLNGRIIYIVQGNHDWRWNKDFSPTGRVRVLQPMVSVKIRDIQDTSDLTLCHYPMLRWNKGHYGAYHAFGHVHGSLAGIGRSMDVGVDALDYFPINWLDFKRTLEKEETFKHH